MNRPLNNDLERLTNDILASYRADARTQRIGQMFLPSRERIVEIVKQLEDAGELVVAGRGGKEEVFV